jgi:hypothetical protein
MFGSNESIMIGRQRRPTAHIYDYSSGIGMSVSLFAAHIAGCPSGRAIVLAILTSKHCLHQRKTYSPQSGTTDMVFYVTRLRIFRLKVHDTHLADLCLER